MDKTTKEILLNELNCARDKCITTNKALAQARTTYEKAQSAHHKNVLAHTKIDLALSKLDGRSKIIPSRASKTKDAKTMVKLTSLLNNLHPKKKAEIMRNYRSLQTKK